MIVPPRIPLQSSGADLELDHKARPLDQVDDVNIHRLGLHVSSPYTPPDQPQEPRLQYVAPSSGRPAGVTVFAILNILFGITGCLGTIASAAMMFVGSLMGPNPVADAARTSTGYMVFFVVSMVLGLIFSVVLLASGIGLWKMSKAARKMALAYGVYAILATLVGNVVNVFFIFLPMFEQAAGQQGAQQGIIIGSIAGAVFGGLVGLIFPVSLLIYFLLPSVKERFETWEPLAV